jgi:hypothetical protein
MNDAIYQNIPTNSMKEVGFSIINWDAWAPGLVSHADWQAWAEGNKTISEDYSTAPPTDNIPPMQARRLSNLTKMSLKVALSCTKKGENIESIFASRYGEWNQTLKLLRSISDKEDVSPAGFSMSVHNTAGGIYSIINENTAAYTAIAACSATFEAVLVEAFGRLQTQKYVLVVVAEEAVPPIYEGIFPESFTPFALGLLLCSKSDEQAIAKFNVKPGGGNSGAANALDFIKWFLKQDASPIKFPLFEICHA